MSKLEDIVVSLKMAKELVEAGIVVDSFCFWGLWNIHAKIVYVDPYNDNCVILKSGKREFKIAFDDIIPAPTFEELWKILPESLPEISSDVQIYKHDGNCYVNYIDMGDILVEKVALKPCEALAEILIALKKEK